MPANNEIIPQSVREAAQEAWVAGWGAYFYHTDHDDDAAVSAVAEVLAQRQNSPTPNTDSVPAGMVLVPEVPTEAMCEAFSDAIGCPGGYDAWSAMIAAAPTGSSDSYTPAGEVERLERLFDQAFADGIKAGETGDHQILAGSASTYARAALTQGGSHGTE